MLMLIFEVCSKGGEASFTRVLEAVAPEPASARSLDPKTWPRLVGVGFCGSEASCLSPGTLKALAEEKCVKFEAIDPATLHFPDSDGPDAIKVVLPKIMAGLRGVRSALQQNSAVYIYCHAGQVRSVLATLCLLTLSGLSFASAVALLYANGKECDKIFGHNGRSRRENFLRVARLIAEAGPVPMNQQPRLTLVEQGSRATRARTKL